MPINASAGNPGKFERALISCLDTRELELILLPTEQCNFRCAYCYETFELGRMNDEIADAVKKLISLRVGDIEHLKLSWFGGEPLLAKQILLDVSSHAQKACGETVLFSGNVTTNGYLLDEKTRKELLSAGIRDFQISLDGLEPHHDKLRRTRKGGGSFARIWANLLAMKNAPEDFRIVLRLHFQSDALDAARTAVEAIAETFAGDSRFRLFLKELARLGGANDGDIAPPDPARRAEFFAWAAGICAGRIALVREGIDIPDACYAARLNSLLIRADGRIGKCTVALADPLNDLGRIGPDGEILIDNGRLAPWIRGIESGAYAELLCPYAGLRESAAPAR